MKTQRGFTLIEILVALTLFAAVGGTLLQLFHSGLKTARIAEERAHAALLARSVLSELQVYAKLTPGTRSGRFDDGFHWRAELTRDTFGDEDARGRLLFPLNLTLSVSRGESDAPPLFEIRSLLITRTPPS